MSLQKQNNSCPCSLLVSCLLKFILIFNGFLVLPLVLFFFGGGGSGTTVSGGGSFRTCSLYRCLTSRISRSSPIWNLRSTICCCRSCSRDSASWRDSWLKKRCRSTCSLWSSLLLRACSCISIDWIVHNVRIMSQGKWSNVFKKLYRTSDSIWQCLLTSKPQKRHQRRVFNPNHCCFFFRNCRESC